MELHACTSAPGCHGIKHAPAVGSRTVRMACRHRQVLMRPVAAVARAWCVPRRSHCSAELLPAGVVRWCTKPRMYDTPIVYDTLSTGWSWTSCVQLSMCRACVQAAGVLVVLHASFERSPHSRQPMSWRVHLVPTYLARHHRTKQHSRTWRAECSVVGFCRRRH